MPGSGQPQITWALSTVPVPVTDIVVSPVADVEPDAWRSFSSILFPPFSVIGLGLLAFRTARQRPVGYTKGYFPVGQNLGSNFEDNGHAEFPHATVIVIMAMIMVMVMMIIIVAVVHTVFVLIGPGMLIYIVIHELNAYAGIGVHTLAGARQLYILRPFVPFNFYGMHRLFGQAGYVDGLNIKLAADNNLVGDNFNVIHLNIFNKHVNDLLNGRLLRRDLHTDIKNLLSCSFPDYLTNNNGLRSGLGP